MSGPGNCAICGHPQQAEINEQLAAGVSYRKLSAKYGMSINAISRHKRIHFSPNIIALRPPAIAPSPGEREPVLQRLERHLGEVVGFLAVAQQQQNTNQGISALREVRATLELIAKITGELDERPTTVINLETTSEWVQMRTAIIQTLAPWPEARLAVAERLEQLSA